MDEATDRCWAFSASGDRCELPAGHDDKHAITKAWSNDECWKPGQSGVVIPPMDVAPEVEHLTPAPPDYSNSKCFCEHPYHGREVCGVIEADGEPCDCANAIAI